MQVCKKRVVAESTMRPCSFRDVRRTGRVASDPSLTTNHNCRAFTDTWHKGGAQLVTGHTRASPICFQISVIWLEHFWWVPPKQILTIVSLFQKPVMPMVQSVIIPKKSLTPTILWQKLWTIAMAKLKWNLGWMSPSHFCWCIPVQRTVQYASKTLLSSEIMKANPEAIFYSRKYLENKVERIAQFPRKLISELWMQIRHRAQFKRIWAAYKLWKLDPNSQVLANVVFFTTLMDWNNQVLTIIQHLADG